MWLGVVAVTLSLYRGRTGIPKGGTQEGGGEGREGGGEEKSYKAIAIR